MALDHKPLDQLNEANLLDLVTNAVAEGTMLDYKAELPTNQDESKREFLRDAVSFANTAGGHLIFGMTETGGVPDGVPGVVIPDVEDEKLRLENMLRDGVAPRLPQPGMVAVPLSGGDFVVVVRFARSWQRPHMVTFKNDSRFFARHSTGKYQLNVDQIRSAVMAAPTAAARIRDFRDQRLDAVRSGNVPGRLEAGGAKLVIHLIPLDALDEGREWLDIGAATTDQRLKPLVASTFHAMRWTLDGLYTDDHWGDSMADAAVQLFRTGTVESVDTRTVQPRLYDDDIAGQLVESYVIPGVQRYLEVQRDVGATLPVVVLVTLLDASGRWISTGAMSEQLSAMRVDLPRIDRNTVALPEVLIEAWDADVTLALRPVFDAFWQSSGIAASPSYDDEGNWREPS